ncbi:MAG: hypothetical protein J6X65_10565 [Bacteroidales bacterium]|nr:hypothetical protein [Bacteroidales bacterium]
MKTLKTAFILAAVAILLAASCEKDPIPVPTPDPEDDPVASDSTYREKWEGRYWPENGGNGRIRMFIQDGTDSLMTMSSNVAPAVNSDSLLVRSDGSFEYVGSHNHEIVGYFYAEDSLYVHVENLQYDKSFRCVRIPDYVPAPNH